MPIKSVRLGKRLFPQEDQQHVWFTNTSGPIFTAMGTTSPRTAQHSYAGTAAAVENEQFQSDLVAQPEPYVVTAAVPSLGTYAWHSDFLKVGSQLTPSWNVVAHPETAFADANLLARAYRSIPQWLPKIEYVPGIQIVETQLGPTGHRLLRKVLELVNGVASEMDLPLRCIQVQRVLDAEVQDWDYLLVLLECDCPFDDANGYLRHLYDQMDILARSMDEQECRLLQDTLFFDIKVGAHVSSD